MMGLRAEKPGFFAIASGSRSRGPGFRAEKPGSCPGRRRTWTWAGAGWRRALTIFLSLALLLPGKAAPAAHAAGGPDLAVSQLVFHPSSPATLQPVTAEIVVENGGELAGETTVALEWCCGRLERPLQALGPGESAAVLFEHALAFPQAGTYPITATADASQLLAEGDEGNNLRVMTLTVTLPGSAPAPPSSTATWGDQRDAGAIPIDCPDTELMRIGRREPLLLQDRCPDQWGNDRGCPAPDKDGDGILEGPAWRSPLDLCPDEPGPAYFNGCPLADRDGDRTPDEEDACPDEPGPRAGGAQAFLAPLPGKTPEPPGPEEPVTPTVRGCPVAGPAGDRDGDGVDDAGDACPDQWGPNSNGCPDRIGDRDGDGVLDAADDCPNKCGLADNRGCPLPDADGDGVADAKDRCPAKAGPGSGCPPLAIEANDPDADGVANVLARVDDTCELEDDPITDAGCQAYVQGQEENACGTTSLAYVLQYFGKECFGEPCTPQRLDSDIRSNDLKMYTDPIALQEYAQSVGMNAEVYVDRDVQDIRWFVERGIPVLLEIINDPGTASVDGGHWVVAISFCELGQGTGGTTQTHIGIFDPAAKQYAVTPEVLYQYWHDAEYQLGEAAIPLWNRLFVAVSDQSLPPGNSDNVRAQLALAQGVATGATGLQDLADCFGDGEIERLGEGLVELGGGFATALLGLVSNALTWGDDLPLIGGALGSLGNLGGQLTLAAEDIVNSVADLLNPSNWTDLDRLGEILGDLVTAVGEGVLAIVKGVWDFVVDGIGGFFADIWDGLKSLGCDWFGWGCPDYYSYYKHYASADACQETFLYANGMLRQSALGYIYTSPVSGTHPVYLLAAGPGPEERTYRLCTDPNCTLVTPTLSLGVVGYALDAAPPGGAGIDLNTRASAARMNCNNGAGLGYLLRYYQEGTTPLWLFQSQESKAYAAFTDSCAGTETFFGPELKGYTRDIAVGLISPSELAGGRQLYRFFNADTQDCLLSTDPQAGPDGYVNQGYLGYIYSDQEPGTVPLYQCYDADHEDHLITTDPGAEGLAGYGGVEVLGYVAPASDLGDASLSCSVPLWRFCKRVWVEK